jgi:hypothetical protein
VTVKLLCAEVTGIVTLRNCLESDLDYDDFVEHPVLRSGANEPHVPSFVGNTVLGGMWRSNEPQPDIDEPESGDGLQNRDQRKNTTDSGDGDLAGETHGDCRRGQTASQRCGTDGGSCQDFATCNRHIVPSRPHWRKPPLRLGRRRSCVVFLWALYSEKYIAREVAGSSDHKPVTARNAAELGATQWKASLNAFCENRKLKTAPD